MKLSHRHLKSEFELICETGYYEKKTTRRDRTKDQQRGQKSTQKPTRHLKQRRYTTSVQLDKMSVDTKGVVGMKKKIKGSLKITSDAEIPSDAIPEIVETMDQNYRGSTYYRSIFNGVFVALINRLKKSEESLQPVLSSWVYEIAIIKWDARGVDLPDPKA